MAVEFHTPTSFFPLLKMSLDVLTCSSIKGRILDSAPVLDVLRSWLNTNLEVPINIIPIFYRVVKRLLAKISVLHCTKNMVGSQNFLFFKKIVQRN